MRRPTLAADAFSLVEVTLALGVAAVSLIAIFSLLPIGLQINQRSIEQTALVDILSAVASDLRATPATNPRGGTATSTQFGISIPAAGATGTATLYFNSAGQAVTLANNPRYRVTVNFLPNSGGARTATLADLRATWPALVDPSSGAPAGSAEMFAAFDRN